MAQLSASALSNKLTAILKANRFRMSAPKPDIDGARRACLELFGNDQAAKIEAVLDHCAATVLAGENYPGMPANLKAHTAYCNAANDLCGFPDEALVSIKAMLAAGHTMASIAHEWGWDTGRLTIFYNGDRSAFFLS